MYNIDDAIAKIDGYVISIAGGGPFVGESKLIKIDEVKRTAAYASIVTGNGVPETPPREPEREAGAEGERPVAEAPERPETDADDAPEDDGEASYNRTAPRADAAGAAEADGGVLAHRAATGSSRLQQRMTYAIIEMGGKQYRVEEGDSILVDRVGRGRGREGAPRGRCSSPTARTR